MVIGAMMMLAPLWGMVGQAMTFSSLIFYAPNVEVPQTEFMINNQSMYLPKIGDSFATLSILSVNLEVPI